MAKNHSLAQESGLGHTASKYCHKVYRVVVLLSYLFKQHVIKPT